MAGSLKRANPELNEDVILIRALRDSNIPTFLANDSPLFHAIVLDLFPGTDIPPRSCEFINTVTEWAEPAEPLCHSCVASLSSPYSSPIEMHLGFSTHTVWDTGFYGPLARNDAMVDCSERYTHGARWQPRGRV
ncbi:hypothetical protein PF010_g26081 [Phytophthora fragariae]|uniref:Dynein heavy chain hydrolytic ATP-binding dynein motor region domain-containing protein n=1 Tax=Phytophthora fragariae TaxID=53985 RepID=A0A6A3RPT4_9STRA|nr:hypothetical protein PF003_g16191 [Phytophthora fragariae]KAE8940033.1 hypothetical protein PF009_g10151 [Phytophthora fragariae]KAE8973420.1 hypothetical protein PF011_g25263 [Phytophthora fragariae]KAE9070931.1 hypothetical protein PF010_g26081 [Phytophthora fragariae]KAE9083573.1 hypothetical protein PF007_g21841 [Phytophthora fragariae]